MRIVFYYGILAASFAAFSMPSHAEENRRPLFTEPIHLGGGDASVLPAKRPGNTTLKKRPSSTLPSNPQPQPQNSGILTPLQPAATIVAPLPALPALPAAAPNSAQTYGSAQQQDANRAQPPQIRGNLETIATLDKSQANERQKSQEDSRTYSERLVDFIKEFLGEKPQPIDESLLRDGS